MRNIFLPAAFFTALLASSATAPAKPYFPSHCRPDEFSILDARMRRVEQRNGGIIFVKNGKVLSLCADKHTEPYSKVTYRYGPLGAAEIERSASVWSRFALYDRSTSPHTGEDIIFFTMGKHTYYIAVATAQGHGVSLVVYNSGKKVVDLFSGTQEGIDFQMGPAQVNYGKAASPLFVVKEPRNDF